MNEPFLISAVQTAERLRLQMAEPPITTDRAKLIEYHCELGRKAAALAVEEGSHLRGLELALEAVRQFTEASRLTREGMGR